jgi:hypothetical protein
VIGGLESSRSPAIRSRKGALLATDAIRDCGVAAQLIEAKGNRDRCDLARIARAISSFPVPVSPVINTVASVGATARIRSRTLRAQCSIRRFPQIFVGRRRLKFFVKVHTRCLNIRDVTELNRIHSSHFSSLANDCGPTS